jgi:hypothetical protein
VDLLARLKGARIMHRTIHVYGAKGGVGTSTVATLIALEHSRAGGVTILSAADGDHTDLHTLMGAAAGEDAVFMAGDPGDALTVVDHGTTPPVDRDPGDQVFLVLRPCYLAIRRALGQNCRPDGIILLTEDGRSLGVRDVEDVLGVRVVAIIPVTQTLARSIDAGLLARHSRRHVNLDVLMSATTGKAA